MVYYQQLTIVWPSNYVNVINVNSVTPNLRGSCNSIIINCPLIIVNKVEVSLIQ